MEVINLILDIITTHGVAIAVSIALIYQNIKLTQAHKEEIQAITKADTEQIKQLNEEYNKKVEGFTNAVNNNTRVMEEFIKLTQASKVGE